MFDPIKNIPSIHLAAYSYDGGVAPYTGENPNLLQVFRSVIYPDITYWLELDMYENGTSSFSLFELSSGGMSEYFVETQTVLHNNTCVDNYF